MMSSLDYKPARFFPFTARLTTFSGHSPVSTRRTSPGAPACNPAIACSLYQAACGATMTFSRPRSGCGSGSGSRSEEHTSELQSRGHLVCRLLLEKKKEDMHLNGHMDDP